MKNNSFAAFTIIVSALCAQTSSALDFPEPAPLIIDIDNRTATTLNGHWHTIIDPYEVGAINYRGEPTLEGYFKNSQPRSKSDLIEYSFNNSPTLNVPGDWNTQRSDLYYYEGTVWYKKSFDYTPKSDKRAFLYFGAANYETLVKLNGQILGKHIGGFTPFCFEITGAIKSGENTIIAKVNNTRKPEGVPTTNTDWWNYGGITRRVLLVETPETFIRNYFVQLDPENPDQIKIQVQLDGKQKEQPIHLEIPEAGISCDVGTTNDDGYTETHIAARNITNWSPRNPKLYKVIINSKTDVVTDQIGFRTIRVKGKDILLNGKPIFLKGVCVHEEAPIRTGRAFGREDANILLDWAQELGCNFVRLAHYPHNEAMVRAADEKGLLVWAEVPVYWTIKWNNQATYTNAENQISEVITRDRNRACVVLWSVANETPLSDSRMLFLQKLISKTRKLDPSRLVTAALESHYVDKTTIMIDDPLGEYLDVLGCNEYIGWYDGLPEKARTITWSTVYDKPLIMSEFGAGALAGYHADPSTRWTEDYQANLYRKQLKMLENIDFLRGTCPWILMDFRSPRRQLANIQDGWNRKGLISERGQRKQAFKIMQEYYHRENK